MKYDTSELCDIYQEDVNVVEPLFSNFGGRSSFGGQIITVKCFEDNGLLYDLLEQNGRGHILLIDGGGSVRRALIDADLARLAVQNEWEGLVVYGAVRQVDDLEELDIGIQALAAIPVGAAGEGIGGPHVGYDMAWPMSIMMKAFTSQDDAEIKRCVEMLMTTDAGTGFMHESFNVNDPTDFTRSWFAWQNTLFGELILKLVNEGKVDLLNSITVK